VGDWAYEAVSLCEVEGWLPLGTLGRLIIGRVRTLKQMYSCCSAGSPVAACIIIRSVM